VADAWLAAWAKTARDRLHPTTYVGWLPLHQHLADAAGVAARLVDDWISPQVIRRIARDLGGDHDDVRAIVTWLAAVHDVGKLSPAFAVQVPRLADAMRGYGLIADPRLGLDPDRPKARHESVGQLAVREWLHSEMGFEYRGAAAQLACVVGGHHGEPPSRSALAFVAGRSDLSGGQAWQQARRDALVWATSLVGRDVLARFGSARLGQPTQALLTAIVIVADWVASNADFFTLLPLHTAEDPPTCPDPVHTAARVAEGWAALSLPARWSAAPVGDVDVTFRRRFGKEVRPVQRAAVEAATSQPVPGLVVVEAPMGEGKTEAALLAAEELAARSGADGCFVALPTRATSDAMFSRVLDWMRALPDIDVATSVLLAHGTASLNDEYRGLLRNGRLHAVGEDPDDAEAGIAHHWLNGRKKGPLAQFVVGTIDQVLFAGLKSRFLALRHLGLAGKVVIIDEVHAYDVYMARYLDTVLQWLGAYGTPVVLLSATLPADRRAQLVRAYERGRGGPEVEIPADPGYPVVIASGMAPLAVPASGTPRLVAVERHPDDLDVLAELLREGLADGGCAVVVRNTVTRVQETADRLIAEFGPGEVTVTHSRFLASDRARLDDELLRCFGPPGDERRRPKRHVVVASQVVEQSLDVDFDLMITDLAPADLVLQRMGRLHRHTRLRPPRLEQPRCVLVGTKDWTAEPVQAVRGSRAVYGTHSLLRAAALFAERTSITLPDDIAPIVQAAYGPDPLGPQAWQGAMATALAAHKQRADRRREDAGVFLLRDVGGPAATLDGWVRAGVGDADDDPRGAGRVRDGDESVEVLVVQRDRDGGILTPSWVEGGGVQIPLDTSPSWELARVIAACALRLPPGLSRMDPVGDGVIRALERNRYASFAQQPLLSGQLVLVLDGDGTAVLRDGAAHVRLRYDPSRGLSYEAL
jgi:CRISPR-associated helicase Cas3/CRISPR-associated endonuclease Cas3-HD